MTIDLFKYKLGTVVKGRSLDPRRYKSATHKRDDFYGHIIGFDMNDWNETLLKVLWEDGQTHEIHPTNVTMEGN